MSWPVTAADHLGGRPRFRFWVVATRPIINRSPTISMMTPATSTTVIRDRREAGSWWRQDFRTDARHGERCGGRGMSAMGEHGPNALISISRKHATGASVGVCGVDKSRSNGISIDNYRHPKHLSLCPRHDHGVPAACLPGAARHRPAQARRPLRPVAADHPAHGGKRRGDPRQRRLADEAGGGARRRRHRADRRQRGERRRRARRWPW